MYYFIPAWYGSNRPWHADLTPWYYSHFRFEFDDTFNQIRLFQRQGIQSRLLVLAYQPHLRYFLHRHGVLETEVYSVFDDLQDFQNVHTQVLNIRDIEWDSDCQFLYSPFAIVVQKNGKKYAKVEHGVEGFISDIQYFDSNGQINQHYIMDDRGFVSSVMYFDNGQPTYQDYLDPKGIWRFREYIQEGGRIEVNPIFGYRFKQLHYADMSQLIAEYFDEYQKKNQKKQDIFIIPSHPHHDQFIFDHIPSEKFKILSLFINRNSQDSYRELSLSVDRANLVLVDREDSLQLLKELYPERSNKFHHLSPFDTRLRLGRSQTRKESVIYYQLDFNDGLTTLYSRLAKYSNIGIDNATLTNFEFSFNSPKMLNYGNINDLLATSDNLSQYIIKTMVGENNSSDDSNITRDKLVKVLNQILLPMLPWQQYEEAYDAAVLEVERQKAEDKVRSSSNNEE